MPGEVFKGQTSSLGKESSEDQITHLMAKGEEALVEGRFPEAAKIFIGLIYATQRGKITDWPHFTQEDQEQDSSLRHLYFMQKPHAPTQSDVFLGLCFAYLGQGEREQAESYLRDSGFFTLSPSNFAERKQTCRLAGEHDEELRQILAQEPMSRKPRSLTRWERIFEVKGYEGVVSTGHTTWLDSAMRSFLRKTQERAVTKNDLAVVYQDFSLLEKLCGWGRYIKGETVDDLYGFACQYAEKQEYELALVFLKEYVKFETPFIYPAAGVLNNWANKATHRGNLGQAEWLLEQIPSLEPSYEYEMTSAEYGALKLQHLQNMLDGYYSLLEKAREIKRQDLVDEYTRRRQELKEAIARRK